LVKLDPQLHLLEVGGAAARVGGRGRDALLGLTLQAAALFGDKSELVERRCREALGAGESSSPSSSGPPGSGTIRCDSSPSQAPTACPRHCSFIGRDETERIQAEQALLRSQRQLAELLEREKKRRQAEALARNAHRANRIKDEFWPRFRMSCARR
jgi:hypothetical protein